MRYIIILLIGVYTSMYTFAQKKNNPFLTAYSQLSKVPKGTLEAVSYNNTRMLEITENDVTACSGLPQPFGIMGVFDNGKNYFLENGKLIGKLSGISIQEQKSSIEKQVLAYGLALDSLMKNCLKNKKITEGECLRICLLQLSEIPHLGLVNDFARNTFVWEVFKYLNDLEFAETNHFDAKNYDLAAIFGADNYLVLSAKKIEIKNNKVLSQAGVSYKPLFDKSLEYGPAIWTPAPACNISNRNGTLISAITIHTVQGTYSGAISWAQNCNSSVSYHYVVRSSDGQITQMVLEAKKAWHVGSENPYTIGYEHEGYVNNPVWYTEALYQGSANLSKDIIASGYGINGLRTYCGPSSANSTVLGSCTKIKGHQHYPNQTHTDPGINWNWEKYYRLINTNPIVNTITSASGSLYDTGGLNGNYTNDERSLWLIQPANANTITLSFSVFSLENNIDKMYVYNGSSINSPLIGVYSGNTLPPNIVGSNGALLIEFRSDCGNTAAGWAATYNTSISSIDLTPPTSTISNGPIWQVADFQTQINDTDVGSGVEKGFYLVADRNYTDAGWKANGTFGFVHEDFQDANINWTLQTGLFTINNQSFLMSDASQNNSNAYLNVVQNVNSDFLYEWEQKIISTNLNQRAGMHFFCSDPTLPNRGNSYFVYLREETNKVQIYKVSNDVFTLVNEDTLNILPQVNYALKTWYKPSNGIIKVYINNQLISQWQDANPLTIGNSISLRTGACSAQFDNIKVFKSRATNISVTVGNNQQMRFQSNGAIKTGLILSEVIDIDQNWGTTSQKQYLIDWTTPTINYCNDGASTDIDTSYSNTLECNWMAVDPHSGIINYEYALGTSVGATNIINWTNNALNTSVQQLLANPIYGQTYYYSIRAENGALLTSTISSDGQILLVNSGAGIDNTPLNNITIYPNPSNGIGFFIGNIAQKATISVYDIQGKLIHTIDVDSSGFVETPGLAAGTYNVLINIQNKLIIKRLIVE